jgi:AcrR family transcriptional regulator
MNSSRERASQQKGRRGGLRQRFREETHAAVLHAAEAVFAEEGLHQASMAEIARRAGVAVGTLYNHFADREALLNALTALRKRELLDEIDARLHDVARGSFMDQLVALVTALFKHVDTHRSLFRLLLADERAGRSAASNQSAREIYQRFEKVVRRGLKDGVLRDEAPPELLASLLLGTMRGVMMREVYGAPSGPMVDCVGPVVDFFLHGSRKPSRVPVIRP